MGLINALNTNYENGVTDTVADSLAGSMGQLDPVNFITDFDDFLPYVAERYTVTLNGGTVAAAAHGAGGFVLLTTVATNGESTSIQTINGGISFAGNARTRFKARLKGVQLGLTQMFAGIAFVDGADPDFVPEDGLWFESSATSNEISLKVSQNNVITTLVAVVATVSDDEWFTCEWLWDGDETLYYEITGDEEGFETVTGSVGLDSTDIPNRSTANTLISQTGADAIRTLESDYLLSTQER